MHWRPHAPREGSDIYSLKQVLGERYWGSTLNNSTVIDRSELPFLEGIVAAGDKGEMAKDAKKLIAAIRKHGEVEIWISE